MKYLHQSSPPQRLEESAHTVFLAWEKLRLIYNGVLLAVVLMFINSSALPDAAFWQLLLRGACFANLYFCAGSVVEGYGVWLGANRQTVRWICFTIGTLLACLLVFWRMGIYTLQSFD